MEARVGTRGANNTSADAAIRFRNQEGGTELALIEWKYTESYPVGKSALKTSVTSKETRDSRYRHLFDDPDGPLHHDVVPYDDLYFEPFYQLMRLSLLAWQVEMNDPGIERVRVVYCAPAANHELWNSLSRPTHVGDVASLWHSMQRRPDRFVVVDTAVLVEPSAPTSTEFKDRYGHLAKH